MATPTWNDGSNPFWVNMKLGGGNAMDNKEFKGNYEKYKYLGQKSGGDYVFFNDAQYLNAAKGQEYSVTNLEDHRNKIADQTKKNETQTAINKALVARDKVWQESVDKMQGAAVAPAPRARQEQLYSGTKSKRYSVSDNQNQFNSLLSIKNLLGE